MSVRDFLASQGLPARDLGELPTSAKRFPDGAWYRVEIPSTEGPRCLEAVLEEASRLDVRVHRVSQGTGVALLTGERARRRWRRSAGRDRVEVSLFARPNAGWGASASARAPAGGGARRGGVGRRAGRRSSSRRSGARRRSGSAAC